MKCAASRPTSPAITTNYKNLQVSSFLAGLVRGQECRPSRIWGFDGSVHYRLTDGFNIDAGAAYTHARYTSFKNAPYSTYCNPAVTAFSGQPLTVARSDRVL